MLPSNVWFEASVTVRRKEQNKTRQSTYKWTIVYLYIYNKIHMWCACNNMHNKDGGQDDGLIQWSFIMALLGYLIQHVSKSPTIQINKPFHTHHKHERVIRAFEPLRHNNGHYEKVERATFP